MSGHGHVTPNPDGTKARCGGPGICPQCSQEAATAGFYGDRPEMLSDRLGYPPERGDEDWAAIKAARKAAAEELPDDAKCPTCGQPLPAQQPVRVTES